MSSRLIASPPPALRQLPRATRAFLLVVMGLAPAAVGLATIQSAGGVDPLLLGLALGLCAGATLFEVLAPGTLSLQVSLVFFAWGAMLLPPWCIGALAIASFAAGALPGRARWYVAGFNAANYALAGLAAHAVAAAIARVDAGTMTSEVALALLAAAGALVAVNHALVVAVVRLAHGRSLRDGIEESLRALPLDLALALSGAVLAALWVQHELLAALAVGPLLLMYRGLDVPRLQHQSRLDPKTGLFNCEHLGVMLDRALEEARCEGGHVAVLMLDLDHLRAVNTRWGHLAGDRVIQGLAEIIAAEVRPTGVAARFGGEEFCIVLPGAATTRALEVAETIRRAMAETAWDLVEGADPLRATVSIGVAIFPEHGETPDAVVDAADAAAYDAKLGGRNRVRLGVADDTVRSVTAAADAQALSNLASLSADDATPRLFAVEEEAELPAHGSPDETPVGPRPFLPGVLALVAGTAVLAALCSPLRIVDKPIVFAALVAGVLLLDLVRIDVFDRGAVSPAAVPSIALAIIFGPLGPIFAEGVIALSRLARRVPTVGLLADFGMLSITGAATAGVWIALDPAGEAGVIGAGAVTGLASYLVNAALMLGLTSARSRPHPVAAWREGWAWLWPHYLAFGVLAGGLVVAERAIGWWGLVVFAMPVAMLWLGERQYLSRSRSSVVELRAKHDELESANGSLRALVAEKQALLSRMHRSYLSTITSLARTIEAKDPYTGGHTERVARIACALAHEMGFDAVDVRAVNVGAVIHDIGKIGIPDRILLKPGALDDEELAEIQRHPEISSYILADLDLPPIVKQMTRSHHERFAGGGYPDGLVGEEIPLAARILTVADALDAMTSDRPYRRARPLDEALAEIAASSGDQFCPRVVEALERCVTSNPELARELFGATVASAVAG